MSRNSFGTQGTLGVGGLSYTIHRLAPLATEHDIEHLPFSLKILLENLLRNENGVDVTTDDITALADFTKGNIGEREIAFSPARILFQDLTGVPAVVDLAAMREAVATLGGRPSAVNPQVPVDLVFDHSVVVDYASRPDAFALNSRIELDRNIERFRFLRWGQQAFQNFRLVAPENGICHQVNLELLCQCVFSDDSGNAYPDSLVGGDSHTPMANGLSVLAWGVGGIEAEAAMLGQPISMLVPPVVGLRVIGELPEGATATDMVLTLAQLLRKHGVVGKFVEAYGPGVANVPVENRATIGNMSPEYGSTVTIFPIDDQTLRYLRLTGRSDERIALVEAYAKEQGLWHDPSVEPIFSEHLELDLSTVVPSLAGPSRPQDRVPLNASKQMFHEALAGSLPAGASADASAEVSLGEGEQVELRNGHVVIAAITSCTNTSNPHVMLAAGLLAKAAVERGLSVKPWVKTSLAPGSLAVMEYYERAGLTPYLEKLGFGLVGFGCTTCIGNSGPIAPELSSAIAENSMACVAVLSGNRNFEGRIHPDVRMNYLASPPLVVAYALAGTMDIDVYNEPLTTDENDQPVYLRDLWPTNDTVLEVAREAVQPEGFTKSYASAFIGDQEWQNFEFPKGDLYAWDEESTYIRKPPFFDNLGKEPEPVVDIEGARVLGVFGDSVTTDHISPAGNFRSSTPAGRYLLEHGVKEEDFNSYGARRGNYEVMVRGTFANSRVKNALASKEGPLSVHFPDGTEDTIYDVAMRYGSEGTPLIIIAGKEYGSGSSRDWAAKGPLLQGVRAVIAETFERIHRSNLIGMGIAPLQFLPGEDRTTLGLTGQESYTITGLTGSSAADLLNKELTVSADDKTFRAKLRIDTLTEAEYLLNGGILRYVVRRLAAQG